MVEVISLLELGVSYCVKGATREPLAHLSCWRRFSLVFVTHTAVTHIPGSPSSNLYTKALNDTPPHPISSFMTSSALGNGEFENWRKFLPPTHSTGLLPYPGERGLQCSSVPRSCIAWGWFCMFGCGMLLVCNCCANVTVAMARHPIPTWLETGRQHKAISFFDIGPLSYPCFVSKYQVFFLLNVC